MAVARPCLPHFQQPSLGLISTPTCVPAELLHITVESQTARPGPFDCVPSSSFSRARSPSIFFTDVGGKMYIGFLCSGNEN